MIPRDSLALVEASWRNVRVLVVGDVMLDQYVWGEVSRISPEAPVPVVRAISRDERPGGAANVALNLTQLGAQVTLAGFAGEDDGRRQLVSLLAQNGIASLLVTTPDSPTTTKLRVVAGHQQVMRLDTERQNEYPSTSCRQLLER